jgi:hypothetical protein
VIYIISADVKKLKLAPYNGRIQALYIYIVPSLAFHRRRLVERLVEKLVERLVASPLATL